MAFGSLDGFPRRHGLTSRRSQPPLALAVPLSRFTSRVGGGSAFFVRQHSRIYMTPRSLSKLAAILWIILLLSAAVFLVLALLSAETQSMNARQHDEWVSLIKTTTDIERLRNIADN